MNRMDAMGIAEEIAPIFKSKIRDKLGHQARYISVHTIDYHKKELQTLIEYVINMHILSDQGDLHQAVIVREYSQPEQLEIEIERYQDLVTRCLKFPDIDPLPLVKVDRERNILILEKINGLPLDRMVISRSLKNFIYGRIYAVMHGLEIERLDQDNIREFMEFMLTHMSFTDEERDSIGTLLESHLIRYSQNLGSYNSKTTVKQENIIFQMGSLMGSLNEELIIEAESLHAYLLCEEPDNLTQDRMRDVAFHFHDDAFREFVQKGKLQNTVYQLIDFYRGYTSVLKSLDLPPLKDIYPSGLTLNLQLIFVAWLFESEKIYVGEFDPHSDRDLLRYTYYLLTSKPFEDIL